MQWLPLPGTDSEISREPVTHKDYEAFARQFGHHVPLHPARANDAVTGVAARDAQAYAAWLSEKGPWRYRLPTVDELHQLAQQQADRIDWVGWPAAEFDSPAVDQDCLDEWIAYSPGRQKSPDNHLHPVVHPLWLVGEHKRVPSAEVADAPHRYVTFRLVRQPKT